MVRAPYASSSPSSIFHPLPRRYSSSQPLSLSLSLFSTLSPSFTCLSISVVLVFIGGRTGPVSLPPARLRAFIMHAKFHAEPRSAAFQSFDNTLLRAYTRVLRFRCVSTRVAATGRKETNDAPHTVPTTCASMVMRSRASIFKSAACFSSHLYSFLPFPFSSLLFSSLLFSSPFHSLPSPLSPRARLCFASGVCVTWSFLLDLSLFPLCASHKLGPPRSSSRLSLSLSLFLYRERVTRDNFR